MARPGRQSGAVADLYGELNSPSYPHEQAAAPANTPAVDPKQELTEWYAEVKRRGLFQRDQDLQQWGHELRRRGLVTDPTQGGLVQPQQNRPIAAPAVAPPQPMPRQGGIPVLPPASEAPDILPVPGGQPAPSVVPPPSKMAPAVQQPRVQSTMRKPGIHKPAPIRLPQVTPLTFSRLPEENEYTQSQKAIAQIPAWMRAPGRHRAEGGPVQEAETKQRVALTQVYRKLPEIDAELKRQAQGIAQQRKELQQAIAAHNAAVKAGKPSGTTKEALDAAAVSLDRNAKALQARAAQRDSYLGRWQKLGANLKGQALHTGQFYAEEEAARVPGVAETLFTRTMRSPVGKALSLLNPAQITTERELKDVPKARALLMLTGQYPELPPLPRGSSEQRQRLIAEKEQLRQAIWNEGVSDTKGNVNTKLLPTLLGRPLTPWQQQLLPVLTQQLKAEIKAGQMARVSQGMLLDAAANAIGIGVGGAVGRKVSSVALRKLEPFLFEAAAGTGAKALAGGTRRLLITPLGKELMREIIRPLPTVLGGAAGGGAGGAAAAFGVELAQTRDVGKAVQAAKQTAGTTALFGAGAAGLHYAVGRSVAGLKTYRTGETEAQVEKIGNSLGQRLGLTSEETTALKGRLLDIAKAPAARKNVLREQLVQDLRAGRQQTPAAEPLPPAAKAQPAAAQPVAPEAPVVPWRNQGVEEITAARDQAAVSGDTATAAAAGTWLQRHQEWDAAHQVVETPEQAQAFLKDWEKTNHPLKRQNLLLQTQANRVQDTDPQFADLLHEAADDAQRFFQRDWAERQGVVAGAVPVAPQVSVWRRLTPEQQAGLNAETKKALLQQDVFNSATAFGGEVPPSALKATSVAALQAEADALFGQAQEVIGSEMGVPSTPNAPIGTPIPAEPAAAIPTEPPAPADITQQAPATMPTEAPLTPATASEAKLPAREPERIARHPSEGAPEYAKEAATRTYDEWQEAIDAFDDEIPALPGEGYVEYRERIPKSDLQRLDRLIDLRDERGRQDDAAALKGMMAKLRPETLKGPVSPQVIEAALKKLHAEHEYSIEKGHRPGRVRDLLQKLFSATNHEAIEERRFPEVLKGDLDGAIGGAQTWPNNGYGVNPGNLLRQLYSLIEDIAGEGATAELPKIPRPRVEKRVEKETPPALAAPAPKVPASERRTNLALRKRVEEMSPAEKDKFIRTLQEEGLKNQVTGLPNRLAYKHAEKKPYQAEIDADSLKWWNDEFKKDAGDAGGDALLMAVGKALEKSGLDAYHIGGDEFVVQGNSAPALKKALDRANDYLKGATIEFDTLDGRTRRFKGAEFSFGIGKAIEGDKPYGRANAKLGEAKEARERAGVRATRGERPPGVVEVGEGQGQPKGQQELARDVPRRRGGAAGRTAKPAIRTEEVAPASTGKAVAGKLEPGSEVVYNPWAIYKKTPVEAATIKYQLIDEPPRQTPYGRVYKARVAAIDRYTGRTSLKVGDVQDLFEDDIRFYLEHRANLADPEANRIPSASGSPAAWSVAFGAGEGPTPPAKSYASREVPESGRKGGEAGSAKTEYTRALEAGREAEIRNQNARAVDGAVSGQPISVVGFRYGTLHIPDTGIFYAVEPGLARAYAVMRGILEPGASQADAMKSLVVENVRLSRPLVIDGMHRTLAAQVDTLPLGERGKARIREAASALGQGTVRDYAEFDEAVRGAALEAGFDGLLYRQPTQDGKNLSHIAVFDEGAMQRRPVPESGRKGGSASSPPAKPPKPPAPPQQPPRRPEPSDADLDTWETDNRPVIPAPESSVSRAVAGLTEFGHILSRTYRDLPRNEYAEFQNFLTRYLRHGDAIALQQAQIHVVESLQGLSKGELAAFERAVIRYDLRVDLKQQKEEVAQGLREEVVLPEPHTEASIQKRAALSDAELKKYPKVKEAIDLRRKLNPELTEKYIAKHKAVTGREPKLDREDYFHRMIIEEERKSFFGAAGSKLKAPKKASYEKQRTGKLSAYNKSYVQSEMAWVSDMSKRMLLLDVLAETKKHDIAGALKKAAAYLNDDKLNGELEALRTRLKAGQKPVDDAGYKKLLQMAADDVLPDTFDGQWDDLLTMLKAPPAGPPSPEMALRLIRYLDWMLETPKGQDTGSLMYRSLLRDAARLREKAGGRKLAWEDLVPEGFALWTMEEGNQFAPVWTAPNAMVDKAIEANLRALNVPIDALRKAFVSVGRKPMMVLPEGMAKTLAREGAPKQDPNSAITLLNRFIRAPFVTYALFAPQRFIGGATRDILGNLDASVATNPDVFNGVSHGRKGVSPLNRAVQELPDYLRRNKIPTPDLQVALGKGLASSHLTHIESEAVLGHLNLLEKYVEKAKENPYDAFRRWYLDKAQTPRELPEMVLRYAHYLSRLDQIKAAPDGIPKNIGTSDPKTLRQIKDDTDRAWYMANQDMVPLDEASEGVRELGRVAGPFMRWTLGNGARYFRLLQNSWRDPRIAAFVGRRILLKGAKVVIGAKVSTYVLANIGAFALKAVAFVGMLEAWNRWRHPEIEKRLPPDVRGKPHLIVWADDKGHHLTLTNLGSLPDAVSWFGLDFAKKHVEDYLNGRRNIQQIAAEMALGGGNKAFSLLAPPPVVSATDAFRNRRGTPEPGQSRAIGGPVDRWLHALSGFGAFGVARDIKQVATGAQDIRQRFLVRGLTGANTYDLGKAQYDEIRSRIRDWNQAHGRYMPEGSGDNTMFRYRAAIRFGDKKQQAELRAQLAANHKTIESLQATVGNLSPVRGMKPLDVKEFVESLSPLDQQRFREAMGWYKETFAPQAQLTLSDKTPLWVQALIITGVVKGAGAAETMKSLAAEPETMKKLIENKAR